MNANEQRQILNEKLAGLLGMVGGADCEDLTEHLLTIESLDDIKEYLSQLLGSLTDEGVAFLEDVDKFRRGEDLEAPVNEKKSDPGLVSDSKPPPVAPKAPNPLPLSKPVARKPPNPQPKKQDQPKLEKLRKKSETHKPSTQNLKKPPPVSNKQNVVNNTPQTKSIKQIQPQKKRSMEKGTAKVECGCFGTKHKPLTNCLTCGRISCQREGYDFCNFCGYLVEPPLTQDENDPMYSAWLLKEKVLMHQREKSKRTVVYDAQSDHYGNERNEWLSKKEQAATVSQQEARKEEVHHRRKVQLKFSGV